MRADCDDLRGDDGGDCHGGVDVMVVLLQLLVMVKDDDGDGLLGCDGGDGDCEADGGDGGGVLCSC